MKTLRLSIVLLAICQNAFGQAGKKINEFTEVGIANVAIDRLGDFYLQFQNQSIKKYSTDGKYLNTFSPQNDSITALHPWNPLNVFVYDRSKQSVLFLDNTLSLKQKKPIEPSLAIEPFQAWPASNNTAYWLYDKADFSIKKIDAKTETILTEFDLKKMYPKHTPSLTYVREYQNQLFLLDRNMGINIISIAGKLTKTIPITNILNFGFLGEELYYLQNGKVIFYDLYTHELREVPVDKETKFVLATDERLILFNYKGLISVWEFKPL